MKYMLDTNICIAMMNRKQTVNRDKFKRNTGNLAISVITLGELQYGVEHSHPDWRDTNQENLNRLLVCVQVLEFDTTAALHYAQIREALYSRQKIGPMDNLIASHARSQGMIVVTNNTEEFQRVPGLVIENWL